MTIVLLALSWWFCVLGAAESRGALIYWYYSMAGFSFLGGLFTISCFCSSIINRTKCDDK